MFVQNDSLEEFEERINKCIEDMEKEGFYVHDQQIVVDSRNSATMMLLFSEVEPSKLRSSFEGVKANPDSDCVPL